MKMKQGNPATGALDDGHFDPPLRMLGFSISKFSQTVQFSLVSSGVFGFFILYGYLLEKIFIQPTIKSHGLYMTFIQFILYSIFARFESFLEGNSHRRIPLPTYVLIAFLTVGTMAFSNLSLEYLNYPTQVIFKSCKLIPVLVGGILIQGKRYGAVDFIAASVMCVGLIWFTLIDVAVSPNFHPVGVVMISLALLADAVIGNVQERAMKKYGAPNSEVVFYSYSIGLVYLGIALILTGELVPAIQTANKYPVELYGYGFLLSLTGYLGVNLVLTLVRVAGAFAAVTVTTFRKALSIILSFLIFAKPFTVQYVWSGLLVLLGVYLNLLGKGKPALPVHMIVERWLRYCANTLRKMATKEKTSNNNKFVMSV